MKKAIYNGKLVPREDALVSVLDKGYFFDFSIYSSVKVIKGKPFFLEYHVDRLLASAVKIDLGHQFTKEDLLAWFKLLVEEDKIDDALIRFLLIGDVDENKNAKLFIVGITGLTYYPDSWYKKGIKVITYSGERRIPTAKTKDMLLGFLAFREAKKRDAAEALMIDDDDNIREGTQTNFFAIKGNILITPPDDKTLGGITKKIILEVAASEFEIKKEDIPFADLKSYDEFFISSTTRNIMPIAQIDEIDVSSDFSKIKKLQKLFKDYVKSHND